MMATATGEPGLKTPTTLTAGNGSIMNHVVLLGALAVLAYLAHTVINTQDFNG